MLISSTFDVNYTMKKDKQESPLKAARKKTTKDIELRLVTVFKTITNELGQPNSKPGINIEKQAKKLAKKIAKSLTAAKAKDTVANSQKPKEASTVKQAPAGKLTVANAKKPAIKATQAKTEAPKTEAKTITQKKVKL